GSAGSTTAASALSKGHLDIPEGGFRAQYMLQRFLLGSQSIVPLLLLDFVRAFHHCKRGFFHVFCETLELLVRACELAGLHAFRKSFGLLGQVALQSGSESG